MRYSKELIRAVYDKTHGRCNYCKKRLSIKNYGKPSRKGAWEIDHSVPLSRGGTDHLNNLWPACVDCNRDKSDRTGKSYKQSITQRSSDGCFIATAAYGTRYSKEIDILRDFRDSFLMRSYFGRKFTYAYYIFSPPIAKKVETNNSFKVAVRRCLSIIIWILRQWK